MNKAFVREPDEPDPRCPACGVLGVATPRPVVAAHLPLDATATLSASGFYCANPRCDVAYYDASGASVDRKLLRGGMFPKDASAPICPCTGLTAEQVERDARAGQRDRVKAVLVKANDPASKCRDLCPDGQTCAAEVQRLFLHAMKKPST